MFIKKLQIKNYKSFWDSEDIVLERGFNLIVGQNDAGKSAILEALNPGKQSKPHRSLFTAPEINTPALMISKSLKEFVLTPADLRVYLSRLENVSISSLSGDPSEALAYFNQVLAAGGVLCAEWHNETVAKAWIDSLIPARLHNLHFRNAEWPLNIKPTEFLSPGGNGLAFDIAYQLISEIYMFRAERYRMGSCPAAGNRVLAPDGSNLPEVLNKLAEDPATERELIDHVKHIFPHITHISAALDASSSAHIRIWTHPVSSRRRDLAISLNDSGSGIGQVLAMLYVAVTAERPKVILIDEPQSFLHPGAVRKLFEILSGYSQHQYVVSTHAPTGLNISGATNMLMVRRGESQSTVVRLDPSSQESVTIFLTEVGARLSDVFGADNVLWVEGKTEERCFPILIREVAGRSLGGTQVLGVVNTGDFDAEFTERIITIYQRLSVSASVLPPAIAFMFDIEGKSPSERADIERRGKGLIKWLPRRMFENYLIEPWAICELINKEDSSRSEPLTSELVEDWLVAHGADESYFPKQQFLPYKSRSWAEHVHGGKLLGDICGSLTENRVSYDKVRHGEFLVRLLSKNPTDEIKKLAFLIAEICTESAAPTIPDRR